MNLLLTGPAASGKSTRALQLSTSTPDSFLIVPTATMAEHIRHELARAGIAVRPSAVGTLAQFLDAWGLPPAAPRSLLHILIEEGLEQLRPRRFEQVREFRGLHAELAKLLEDIPEPGECEEDLAALFGQVVGRLAELGFALRNQRLSLAAAMLRAGEGVAPGHAVFDGFFTLGPAEADFIQALGARSAVTVTLPVADDRLVAAGFAVESLTSARNSADRQVFSASIPEGEAEEIARRILEHAAQGRRFREMGVVVRAREPFAPLIEATLARFGIPARGYFLDPLISHPAVQYLSGVVNALLGGWDHAAVNALLRMPVSGVGATSEGDRFDFALREALPGRGLPVAGMKDPPAALHQLQRVGGWRREKLEPVEWATRLKGLGTLLARPPSVTDSLRPEEVNAWRSTAAGVARFGEVVEQVATFLRPGRAGLGEFWKRVETALAVEVLPPQDRRRDVVHVMDVYEARQWQLPVVFVCGLLERTFPRYHGENPVLGDMGRRKLGLPTSVDLQAEERLLFETATTRATSQLVMSYARFDEKGEETLPSFFLNGQRAMVAKGRCLPAPRRAVMPPLLQPVRIGGTRNLRLSATSIEDFLQCPFKYFAKKTLKLKERPAAPRDRLTVLVQGSVLHRSLAEWWQARLLGVGVLDQVFDLQCAELRIPRTYRTEAVRLELLRNFETFLTEPQVERGWDVRVEEQFEFPLSEGLSIRGRIDRLEVGAQGEALVVDYKYSGQVRGRVKETESGSLVQGGLYLLAAERHYGYQPVGMLYCALKGKITWDGWHVPIAGLEGVAGVCTAGRLRELIGDAERKAIETREGILAGRVEAHPKETKKCDWCDYRDICRIETLAKDQQSGAAG